MGSMAATTGSKTVGRIEVEVSIAFFQRRLVVGGEGKRGVLLGQGALPDADGLLFDTILTQQRDHAREDANHFVN